VKLADVQKILQAEVICGSECLDGEVRSACGADLMSDVLVHSKEKTLLLTGLTNIQIIRTAEMGDLVGIPILPPYYALRLLPYVLPSITGLRRSLLRERDLTELADFET
jgi:hypothetical protein